MGPLLRTINLKRGKFNVHLAMQNIELCELSQKLQAFSFFDRRQRICSRFVLVNPSQTEQSASPEAGLLVNKSVCLAVLKVAASLIVLWISFIISGQRVTGLIQPKLNMLNSFMDVSKNGSIFIVGWVDSLAGSYPSLLGSHLHPI